MADFFFLWHIRVFLQRCNTVSKKKLGKCMNFSMYAIFWWNWVLRNTWSFWTLISSTSLSAYCGSRAGSWIAFSVLIFWNRNSASHLMPITRTATTTLCLRAQALSAWLWAFLFSSDSWKSTSDMRVVPPPPIRCLPPSNRQRELSLKEEEAASYSAFNLHGVLFTTVSTNISLFRNRRNRNSYHVEPWWHFCHGWLELSSKGEYTPLGGRAFHTPFSTAPLVSGPEAFQCHYREQEGTLKLKVLPQMTTEVKLL